MAAVDTHNPEWDHARLIGHMFARECGTEQVSLSQSIGRVLAAEVLALTDLPPAHTAMMDGFAVRGEGPWQIVGQVHAGQFAPNLEPGTALQVSTGAHIPALTDMVLQDENTTVTGETVTGTLRNPKRNNVREPGDEARAGDLIAPAGTYISPVVASLAASAGHDKVTVHQRPTVSVIVTGDELLSDGLSRPGAIRDSLTMQIPSWAEYIGATTSSVNRCLDDFDALLENVRSSTANVIVVTGGSAHGPRDFVRPVLNELGAQLLVDEVKSKPGHPAVLALLPSGQFVANLPGNPLAAAVSFMTIVEPVVLKMTGRAIPELKTAQLSEAITSDVTRVMPVTLDQGVATPTEFRGSAMLRGLAHADAFAVVSPGTDVMTARLLPLPWQH